MRCVSPSPPVAGIDGILEGGVQAVTVPFLMEEVVGPYRAGIAVGPANGVLADPGTVASQAFVLSFDETRIGGRHFGRVLAFHFTRCEAAEGFGTGTGVDAVAELVFDED